MLDALRTHTRPAHGTVSVTAREVCGRVRPVSSPPSGQARSTVDAAARAAQALHHMEATGFVEISTTTATYLEVVGTLPGLEPGTQYPRSASLVARVLDGAPAIGTNVGMEPSLADTVEHERLGVGSHVVVPVLTRTGELAGLLVGLDRGAVEVVPTALPLLRGIADGLGAAWPTGDAPPAAAPLSAASPAAAPSPAAPSPAGGPSTSAVPNPAVLGAPRPGSGQRPAPSAEPTTPAGSPVSGAGHDGPGQALPGAGVAGTGKAPRPGPPPRPGPRPAPPPRPVAPTPRAAVDGAARRGTGHGRRATAAPDQRRLGGRGPRHGRPAGG